MKICDGRVGRYSHEFYTFDLRVHYFLHTHTHYCAQVTNENKK